jgi:hypothetical protein
MLYLLQYKVSSIVHDDVYVACFLKQVSYFAPLRNHSVYCEDEVTAACAHVIAKETMRQLVGSNFPNCMLPCRHQKYELLQFVLNMWPPRVPNSSRLFVYLSSSDVMVHEEYCLFDMNAIISSIGGSMALFLGFSCLQLLLYVGKHIFRGTRMRVEYD